MSRISRNGMKNLRFESRPAAVNRQRGASMIAAIFVITALAGLGAVMTQLLVSGSEETINEWYSAQALYAAESGVEYAVYTGGGTANLVVVANRAWVDVNMATIAYGGGKTLYTLTSVGRAGGTVAGTSRAYRQLNVQYMP